ncbi:MAG: hypothetical protein RLZZ450_4412 [Pseudomonadota bacterium]
MSRFLRELRETEGKPSAVGRLRRGLCALGVLVGGSLNGSCLVTNQFEFATPDIPPTVTILNPRPFAQLPRFGDTECGSTRGDAVLFKVVVREPDPARGVWYHLFINGTDVSGFNADELPAQLDSQLRTLDGLCVLHSEFDRLCNRVQLVVAHDYHAVKDPPVDGDSSGRYNVAEWFLVGKALNDPSANPSDCARLVQGDAGITLPLADGAVSPSPADGGSLLPIGTSAQPSDGGT